MLQSIIKNAAVPALSLGQTSYLNGKSNDLQTSSRKSNLIPYLPSASDKHYDWLRSSVSHQRILWEFIAPDEQAPTGRDLPENNTDEVTSATTDNDDHIDCCDIIFDGDTPDEDLPQAEGGVAI